MRTGLKSPGWITPTLLLALSWLLPVLSLPGQAQERDRVPSRSLIAQQPTVTKLDGIWDIATATNVSGQPYTGNVVIRPVGQKLYSLFWQTSAGTRSGIAFLQDNRLFVGWGTDPDAAYGIVFYKIGADGTLDGQWTSSNSSGQTGTERATGGAVGQLAGDYQVTGTNPGSGGRYRGVLNIRQTGDTYQVTWAVGTSYRGVGVRAGDWLVVGWGQHGLFGVTAYTLKGNQATGRQAVLNQPKVGVESLTRRQTLLNQ